jgi:uncharacterized protein DUF4041/Meiotically Up-regulated Gene 113 (MUG113) protein
MPHTDVAREPLPVSVPWFGARRLAQSLLTELTALRNERDRLHNQLQDLGGLTVVQLAERRTDLERQIADQERLLEASRAKAAASAKELDAQLESTRKQIVVTEETALLQEAGVYEYRHPLTDAVSYQGALSTINDEIKEMTKRDGGAVLATTAWTVNNSAAEGRKMVRDFSKLMLRAYNAEADNLVRTLKPYKLSAAIERLNKVAETIEKLGKTMKIRISTPYRQLRQRELELTADFLQKQAEEKEAERRERERLKEEKRAQQEIERERQRLDKERQHYENALAKIEAKGDEEAAARLREQLTEVHRAIADMDYRAANIRAGYVYVISNVGSFGESVVKVGMTRRLDPLDRIRELSDASVPFNFDVHALFFSKDAVGIETAMHGRLASARLNVVNRRREFFRATPVEVKEHLSELAGEMLQFDEIAEALEYRQSIAHRHSQRTAGDQQGTPAL